MINSSQMQGKQLDFVSQYDFTANEQQTLKSISSDGRGDYLFIRNVFAILLKDWYCIPTVKDLKLISSENIDISKNLLIQRVKHFESDIDKMAIRLKEKRIEKIIADSLFKLRTEKTAM